MKWPTVNQMVMWPKTSREWRDPDTLSSQYLENSCSLEMLFSNNC